MKIEITFKDPDALIDCIDDALEDLKVEGLDEEELEELRLKRSGEYQELCSKWFEYGEYLTVVIDTESKTCTVKELT